MSNYYVTAHATTSYVPVAELRTQLLLFGDTSYDAELQEILLAAEEFLADFIGEYLTDTTVRLNVPSFGADTTLPHRYNSGVVVSYWDSSNVAQVLSSANYIVDSSGEYPVIRITTAPTDLSTDLSFAGYIAYTTSLPSVPSKLSRAVLMVAADLFENRADSSTVSSNKAHLTALRLVQSLRGW